MPTAKPSNLSSRILSADPETALRGHYLAKETERTGSNSLKTLNKN
jgi:hypothetical protein